MPDTTAAKLNQPLYALQDFLRREKARGLDSMAVSADTLERLSSLPVTLMKLPAEPVVAAASPVVEEVIEEVATPEQEDSTGDVVADVVVPLDVATSAVETESSPRETGLQEVSNSLQARGIEVLQPEGETKRDKLNNLFRMAKACERCRGLGSLREQLVFATGNPDAELMFVGEAPGAEEEKLKKPFVGPAGQKLDGIIKAMGLSRDEVYISNIVKFRPMIGDGRFQGPKNRKPTTEEMSASVKFVMAEIEVVRPKAIVALGGTAAEGLLDLSGSVSRMRNQFYDLNGVPVMVTYHPSYLLRAERDPDGGRPKKRMVWEDMLKIMERTGMPISDKQRAYFTT